MLSGEIYEGTDDYECACILAGGDAGSADAGVPDVPMDVVQDVLPDVEPNTPGSYPGDIEDLMSCGGICRAEGLLCDARHRWEVTRPGPGDPGGCQATYENGGSPDTQGCGCQFPPQAVQQTNVTPSGALQSYECVCIIDDRNGDLLNEVEQWTTSRGTYQGFFTVTEPSSVTYDIVDSYRSTRNAWSVAMVPMESIEAYPLCTGSVEGRVRRLISQQATTRSFCDAQTSFKDAPSTRESSSTSANWCARASAPLDGVASCALSAHYLTLSSSFLWGATSLTSRPMGRALTLLALMFLSSTFLASTA